MARNKKILPRWCKEVQKTLIEKDMTVTDLANNIHTARTYVSQIVNGSVKAPQIAKLISKELGLDDIPYHLD